MNDAADTTAPRDPGTDRTGRAPLPAGTPRLPARPTAPARTGRAPAAHPAPATPPVPSGPGARPPRVHRAWWIVAVSFLVITCAGAFTGMPGLLVDPLHREFGWSRATIESAVCVNMCFYGLTAPFAAALMDRFGVRRVVLAALATIVVGATATVAMTAAWQLVLCWGVLVGLGSGAIAMAFGALVADRWFVRRRGLVTGVLSSGSMFGGMVCLPLVASVSDRYGWRAATLVVTGFAVLMMVCAAAWLRDHPARLGLRPYGATAFAPEPPPAPGATRRTLAVLRSVARPGPFWLVAGTFAICGASTNGVMMSNFVPAAHDAGLPVETAATLLAVMGVFNVAGTIGSGWLTDRFPAAGLLAVVYGLRAASLLALPWLLGPDVGPGVIAFTVAFGLLDLATVPPTIALCRRFYGPDSAIVFGWVNAAHQLGAGAAALTAGVVRDATGSYTLVWLGVGTACVVAAGLCVLLRHAARRPAAAAG